MYKIIGLQEHFTIKRTVSESSMIQRMSKAEKNRQTQSAPKHRKKSSDLSRRLKAVSDVDEVTLDSRQQCSKRAKPRPEMRDRQWCSGSSTVRRGIDIDADLRRRCESKVRHSVEFIG